MWSEVSDAASYTPIDRYVLFEFRSARPAAMGTATCPCLLRRNGRLTKISSGVADRPI